MLKIVSKISLIILILTFADSAAQNIVSPKPEKNVPIIVLEKFNSEFPSSDPVWFSQFQGRYDQNLVYEGRFLFDNRYSSAVYDKEGNFIAFAATIEKSEIPNVIVKYMDQNYPSFPIADALLVSRKNKENTYEIGIYIDNQYVIQVFSKNGDFIKSTKA